MLEKLENNKVELYAIEQNLTVLIEVDENEIDGIVAILRNLGMSVEENISILSYVTSDRLKQIVKIMQDNGVPNDIIASELKGIVIDTKMGIEIEDIFDDDRIPTDKKRHLRNIKKYMNLTGMMGKHHTKEDLEPLCAKKHITMEEFLGGMLSSNKEFIKLYYNKLMAGGSLYIGPSKPIDNKYLEEHTDEIMELSRIAAVKYARTKFGQDLKALSHSNLDIECDLDELQSLALEQIVNHCGNLVENLQDNKDALRGSIINRTAKYLFGVVERSSLSITQTHTSKSGITFNSDSQISGDANTTYIQHKQNSNLRSTINYEKAEFDEGETEVMECMIKLIENGEANELYKKVAQSIERNEEEVMEIIHGIRRKMIQKQIVREDKKGEYSFNKDDIPNLEDDNLHIETSTTGIDTTDDFDM